LVYALAIDTEVIGAPVLIITREWFSVAAEIVTLILEGTCVPIVAVQQVFFVDAAEAWEADIIRT